MSLIKFGAIGLFLFPWMLIAFALVCTPKYWTAALSDPIGIWFLVAMFIWDCIGLAICFRFDSPVVKIISVVVFTVPLCALTMLIPAIITIVRALR